MRWKRSCSGSAVEQSCASCVLTWHFQSVMTSSSQSGSYEISTSTVTISWRWNNTLVVLSTVASFSWGDCVKSVALLVKKSPSIWSQHSCSADWTTATLYLQAFPSRPSDHCSVYSCSSHHWHQVKGPHHSSSDALTLVADKSMNYLLTVPPNAPYSHQPLTCLHGRDGWTRILQIHCYLFQPWDRCSVYRTLLFVSSLTPSQGTTSLHCNNFSRLGSSPVCLYQKPALKTKFGECAFSHADPAVWNSLPDYIQSESNTKHCKKLLKTYLFTLSF